MAENETITADGEIVQGTALTLTTGTALAGMTRAEIDAQVATARAFPRSISKAMENILSLATYDDEAAAECMYALPRGGKPITGPSIRLAEMAAQCWGNNRVHVEITEINRAEKYVEAIATFLDLETNAATQSPVRRGIVDKNGRIYTDDMIRVTAMAAASIARRNAILAGIPKVVTRRPYAVAQEVVKGTVATLSESREKGIKAFAAFGVVPAQVFAALGVGGEADIKLEHIPVLRAMYSTLKNGEETVEAMFQPAGRVVAFAPVKSPLSDKPAEPAGKPETPETPETPDAEGPPSGEGAGQGGALNPDNSAPPAPQPDAAPNAAEGQGAAAAPAPAAAVPAREIEQPQEPERGVRVRVRSPRPFS